MAFHVDHFGDLDKGGVESIVVNCRLLKQQAADLRAQHEDDWRTDIAFLGGDHWNAAAKDISRFTGNRRAVTTTSTGRMKLVYDYTMPLVRQMAAYMGQSNSEVFCIPATNNEDDTRSAELGADLLQWRFDVDNEEELRADEVLWMLCTGRVRRYTFWNPSLEATVWGNMRLRVGDIATVTLNPFQYYECPWWNGVGDPDWLIVSDAMDIDAINDAYPGKDVQAQNIADVIASRNNTYNMIVGQRNSEQPIKKGHSAIVDQYFFAPTAKAPRGKIVIVCGDKLLDRVELPEGQWAIHNYDWFRLPGNVYPQSFMKPIRSLQMQADITVSQLASLANAQLRGDIVTRGNGVVTQKYVLDANGNRTAQKNINVPSSVQAWEFMKYDLDTQEAHEMLGMIYDCMQGLAGLKEGKVEQLPNNTTTAKIQSMRQADMVGINQFAKARNGPDRRVAKNKLIIAQNHYETPRLMQLVGDNRVLRDIPEFMGSDLKGAQDVRLRPRIIYTEEMKQEMRMTAIDKGLFRPAENSEGLLMQMYGLELHGYTREQIDDMLSPMTFEELKESVGEMRARRVKNEMDALMNPQPTPLNIPGGMGGTTQQIPIPQEQMVA